MEYKELVIKFSLCLVDAIINYRKAEKDVPVDPLFLSEEEQKHIMDEYRVREKSRYVGESVSLKRTEYWNDIIRAKIEVIAAVGGFKMMQDVSYELTKHPDNDKYMFSSRFDWSADGIGGWCR